MMQAAKTFEVRGVCRPAVGVGDRVVDVATTWIARGSPHGWLGGRGGRGPEGACTVKNVCMWWIDVQDASTARVPRSPRRARDIAFALAQALNSPAAGQQFLGAGEAYYRRLYEVNPTKILADWRDWNPRAPAVNARPGASRHCTHHAGHLRAFVAGRRRVHAFSDRRCDCRTGGLTPNYCVPTAYRDGQPAASQQVSALAGSHVVVERELVLGPKPPLAV